jgi:hypothetical protein
MNLLNKRTTPNDRRLPSGFSCSFVDLILLLCMVVFCGGSVVCLCWADTCMSGRELLFVEHNFVILWVTWGGLLKDVKRWIFWISFSIRNDFGTLTNPLDFEIYMPGGSLWRTVPDLPIDWYIIYLIKLDLLENFAEYLNFAKNLKVESKSIEI